MTADLVIVGGGPVGLVTALYARRAGMSPVVIEPRDAPIDKACGEGIMPAGLQLLRDLGVDPPGVDILGIRYIRDTAHADATFSGEPGRGVRRTTLHTHLDDAVAAAGIEVRRVKALGVTERQTSVAMALSDGTSLSTGLVVGADGLHSTVRRWAGLATESPRRRRRRGLRTHFAVRPWTDMVEVYWGARSEAYVTPVADRLVGIAILTRDVGGFDDHLAEFPLLRDRLAGAGAGSEVRGAGPLRQRARRRVTGRVALVGDAAGYVDAITGEGLTVGWRQARELVGCIERGDLAAYEARWRRVVRRSTLLTGGLVVATSIAPVRSLIVPAAQRVPRVYGALVDLAARG